MAPCLHFLAFVHRYFIFFGEPVLYQVLWGAGLLFRRTEIGRDGPTLIHLHEKSRPAVFNSVTVVCGGGLSFSALESFLCNLHYYVVKISIPCIFTCL